MRDVYIVSACRTPIGRFNGGLASLSASDLGAVVIKEALAWTGVDAGRVDEVLMGNVIQGGQGQNPARQAALKAGLPVSVPCTTVNMVCGSGLKSITLAAQAIASGESECIVAGGMESMSNAPYVLPRSHSQFGDITLQDLILRDGLTDAFDTKHMAIHCERLGEKYGISREQQDAFAAMSQQRCEAAIVAGKFADEIVPVKVKKGREELIIDTDEHPRAGTTVESLAKLRPAFEPTGTITAGNASGVNDGASALVLASGELVSELGLAVLGKVVSWASSAMEPALFGIAPAGAVKRALDNAGLAMDDIDLIEANEAFAVQSLALGVETGWDEAKVNVNGGAIALGHPIGASGARIVTTLLYELRRTDSKHGLATLCCGGGMGIALLVSQT